MKRTHPIVSAKKRKDDQTSTLEVGEVGGRRRRQRQKKVVREAGEEENRPEVEQPMEEDAIEVEEEARPDVQARSPMHKRRRMRLGPMDRRRRRPSPIHKRRRRPRPMHTLRQ
ncbi:hypothetical protein RHMOL_Rhmol09G0104600 [Rhododendron molle]|uniref:Uncharacterized protein n=1 Tax=Rhododendron molle TaxID=49168 RepID=A0ACC0MCZ3_RHOML|nr:hypothetical protein RHMOL_Rhmol09G0104600 [Rhododendron molle]